MSVALSTLDRQSIYIYQSVAGTAVNASSITNIWSSGTPIASPNGTPEIAFSSSRINFSHSGTRTVEVLFTGAIISSSTAAQTISILIYKTGGLVASASGFCTNANSNQNNTVVVQWVGTVTSSDYINVYFQNTTSSNATTLVGQGSAVIARFIN